jgi:hypothetical protein
MSELKSFGTSHPRGFVKAQIIPIKPNKELPAGREDQNVLRLGQFYINPTTWSETKDSNWIKHKVPGLSDPIQQWTSSGARKVTFQALVTRDIADPTKEQTMSATCNSKGQSLIFKPAKIAEQVLNIPGLSFEANVDTGRGQGDSLDLSIVDKLNFYRSLLYPNTYSKGSRVFPPNPVALLVGDTFGKRTRGSLFVVDRLEIQITKQYSDLTPIEATVTFTLTELVDKVLSSDTNILTDTP